MIVYNTCIYSEIKTHLAFYKSSWLTNCGKTERGWRLSFAFVGQDSESSRTGSTAVPHAHPLNHRGVGHNRPWAKPPPRRGDGFNQRKCLRPHSDVGLEYVWNQKIACSNMSIKFWKLVLWVYDVAKCICQNVKSEEIQYKDLSLDLLYLTAGFILCISTFLPKST